MIQFPSVAINPGLTMPGAPAMQPAAPSLSDLARFVEGIVAPISEGFRQATAQFSSSIGTLGRPAVLTKPRPSDKWRECCWEGQDPCHCACCIVDADLVIYARLGERRVVPMTIENQWRRERQIKLELSNWSTRGGNPAAVRAQLLPPAPEFTLGPCATETIVMVVESDLAAGTQGQQTEGERRKLPDVDDCTVYYADLRVEGCEIRPIRIALALLPRDCGAFRIVCRCTCC